jgi:rhamnosyltransferase
MKPSCSIVIRAYNEEKHIGRLLSGIFQQTVKDVQVILVDSGSTDATVQIASGFPVEIVHIKPEEFSFGYSLNQGIEHSRADKVVFASAHVYPVYPDWLEKLIQPLNNPQVALTYGKQRGMETTKFSEHMIFQQWFPDHSVKRQDHPFCNNANAAIRRDMWEQHPYDENIPALEDLAWANWAQKQGYQIAYVSEAEVIHVHNETWSGVFNRYRREGMAFKRIYPQERFSLWDLFRLFCVNAANDMRQIRRRPNFPSTSSRNGSSTSSGNGPSTGSGDDRGERKMHRVYEIIRFRWAQFRGTYLGYRQSSNQLTWKLKKTFYYPKGTVAFGETNLRNVEPILYPETSSSTTPGRSV